MLNVFSEEKSEAMEIFLEQTENDRKFLRRICEPKCVKFLKHFLNKSLGEIMEMFKQVLLKQFLTGFLQGSLEYFCITGQRNYEHFFYLSEREWNNAQIMRLPSTSSKWRRNLSINNTFTLSWEAYSVLVLTERTRMQFEIQKQSSTGRGLGTFLLT